MTDLSRTYQDLQSEGSAQCPSAETLAALTLGELPAAERERLADHAVGCRRCSRDAQILLRTHQEASHRLSSRFVRARWLGIAAAVTLIAAGGLLFRSAREGTSRSEGVSRGAGTGETRGGVVPRTGEALSNAPDRFTWTPQESAEGYRVKLFDASGQMLWESERVSKPSVGAPPLVRSRLKSGQSYFWVVEVEQPFERKRLGPFPFSLRAD